MRRVSLIKHLQYFVTWRLKSPSGQLQREKLVTDITKSESKPFTLSSEIPDDKTENITLHVLSLHHK